MKNEQKAINLGLPSGLLWATCNLGANNPEEYGNYYSWGETETKKNYLSDTYKYGLAYTALTKYNTDSDCGIVDNKVTLEAADDAAAANLGGNWRIPTDAEWKELIDNCTWTSTTKNGVKGYEVKGSNGNSIFLPSANCRYIDNLFDAGSVGCYWSSSLDTDNTAHSWSLFFGSDGVYRDSNGRTFGLSVRPVCE